VSFHRRRFGMPDVTRIHKLLTAVGSRGLSPSRPSWATSLPSASEGSTPPPHTSSQGTVFNAKLVVLAVDSVTIQ
jgi:hypothetical protein